MTTTSPKSIEHSGRIISIKGNLIRVQFLSLSGCASCHAKGVCTASDMAEKTVDAIGNGSLFTVGEKVLVTLKQTLGFRAVFYGYVFPFLLTLLLLIVLTSLGFNEAIAGLGALAVLLPYYVILYILRKRIQKKFTFSVRKID
jgi:sigma-E factor negative regulatory protein RseC